MLPDYPQRESTKSTIVQNLALPKPAGLEMRIPTNRGARSDLVILCGQTRSRAYYARSMLDKREGAPRARGGEGAEDGRRIGADRS